MFAVVRHHKVTGPHADILAQRGHEDFAPLIRQMPGFVSYTIKKGQDLVTTISVFETKSAAENSTRRAVEWAAKRVEEFSVPTEVISGEVVCLEVA